MKTKLRGYFITGTGTDVGKTIASAAVAALCRDAGYRVLTAKPVQTGCPVKATRPAPDVAVCLRLAGIAMPSAAWPLLTSYRFTPACSPHLAAARAGIRISVAKIARDLSRLQSMADLLVVEGAGGVLTPLNQRQTMLDLMRELGLPVILVSRTQLGAINHALLSLCALRQAGIRIAGVVFSAGRPGRASFIEKDNQICIPRMGRVPRLGYIPYLPNLGAMRPAGFLRRVRAGLRLTP